MMPARRHCRSRSSASQTGTTRRARPLSSLATHAAAVHAAASRCLREAVADVHRQRRLQQRDGLLPQRAARRRSLRRLLRQRCGLPRRHHLPRQSGGTRRQLRHSRVGSVRRAADADALHHAGPVRLVTAGAGRPRSSHDSGRSPRGLTSLRSTPRPRSSSWSSRRWRRSSGTPPSHLNAHPPGVVDRCT